MVDAITIRNDEVERVNMNNNDKIKWYQYARFGIFIHFGLYTATEGRYKGKETQGIGEWIQSREQIPCSDYEAFASKLTLENFDPEYWAELAYNAGMRYCVFTAKHHDGFAMYDTKYDDYSIVRRSPYGDDPLRKVIDAMRKKGIMPCVYYSHSIDFHEPNAMGNMWDFTKPYDERDFKSYIDGKCKFQLRELLTNYGEIGILWFDMPWEISDEIAEDITSFVRSLQPNCLISGRISYSEGFSDFGCYGDNDVPTYTGDGVWETAATMNRTWGYKCDDHDFRPTNELVEQLCSLSARNTNFLLNVGPDCKGDIPEESISILKEMAKWMKQGKEAIHNTSGSPFIANFSFGDVTQKDDELLLYIYKPVDKISILGIRSKVISITDVYDNEITFSQYNEELLIDCSNVVFDKYVTILKAQLNGKLKIREGVFQQERDTIIITPYSFKVYETVKNDGVSGSAETDVAIVAERKNDYTIMRSCYEGVVNWFSTSNYITATFEVLCPGDYIVSLLTRSAKYTPWVGGHEMTLECNGQTISSILKEDFATTGAPRKYYYETGSDIGEIRIDKPGVYTLKLRANHINDKDSAGVVLSYIHFKRKKV